MDRQGSRIIDPNDAAKAGSLLTSLGLFKRTRTEPPKPVTKKLLAQKGLKRYISYWKKRKVGHGWE